jgi:hypothetical protein
MWLAHVRVSGVSPSRVTLFPGWLRLWLAGRYPVRRHLCKTAATKTLEVDYCRQFGGQLEAGKPRGTRGCKNTRLAGLAVHFLKVMFLSVLPVGSTTRQSVPRPTQP